MKVDYLWVWRFAAWLATRRPVPIRYSLGNIDEVRFSFVHFSVFFPEAQELHFLVAFPSSKESLYGHYVSRKNDLVWDIDEKSWLTATSALPFSKLSHANVEIEEIHGPISVTHKSLFLFCLSRVLFLSRLKLLRLRLSLQKFNRDFRFSVERMSLLADIVDIQRKRGADTSRRRSIRDEFSANSLYTEKYSLFAWQRNDLQKNLDELRFILDSLVESGDLIRTQSGYRLTGQSLKTLSNYEEDNRRNRASKRSNSVTIFFSFAIALATVVQAWVAVSNHF